MTTSRWLMHFIKTVRCSYPREDMTLMGHRVNVPGCPLTPAWSLASSLASSERSTKPQVPEATAAEPLKREQG